MFFQRFVKTGGSSGVKKKTDIMCVTGELDVGKTPLSELGGDRLKEMEKIHFMEKEEVYICRHCVHMYSVCMMDCYFYNVYYYIII